ncbi:MAG: hypothetical protein ACO1NY_13905 [Pseudorhodoplanes sp.]
MGAKMIPIVPRLVMWAAGVVAGLAIASLAKREYGRVNEELDEARLAPAASKAERSQHPTLRRDPRTGVYRL